MPYFNDIIQLNNNANIMNNYSNNIFSDINLDSNDLCDNYDEISSVENQNSLYEIDHNESDCNKGISINLPEINDAKIENQQYLGKKRSKGGLKIKKIFFTQTFIEETEINDTNLYFNKKIEKRKKKKLKRYEKQDNILIVIKRRFMNTYIIDLLNKKLEYAKKSKKFKHIYCQFQKFCPSQIIKGTKKETEKIFGMTLRQLISNKDYNGEYSTIPEKGKNYNLSILEKIKEEENQELYHFFDKTIKELYEEYISSGIYKKELDRLKNTKSKKCVKDKEYIEKYEELAINLINYYFNNKG